MERNPSGHNEKKVTPSESNRVSTAQLELKVNPKPTDNNQPDQPNSQSAFGSVSMPRQKNQTKREDYSSEYTRQSILGDSGNQQQHHLKITYENLAVTTKNFVQQLQKDVEYANNILGPLPEQLNSPEKQVLQRIRWKVNLMDYIKKDIMFKFRVRLFGVEWT